MPANLSRRHLCALLAGAGTLGVAGRLGAQPAVLDPASPQGRAIGYIVDATKVDRARNPQYSPGETCFNCIHYRGRTPQAPCAAVANKLVAGPGWCRIWARRPGG